MNTDYIVRVAHLLQDDLQKIKATISSLEKAAEIPSEITLSDLLTIAETCKSAEDIKAKFDKVREDGFHSFLSTPSLTPTKQAHLISSEFISTLNILEKELELKSDFSLAYDYKRMLDRADNIATIALRIASPTEQTEN